MGAKFVGYLRVSTKKQGKSGLGLDAQKTAVENYAANEKGAVIAWYCDVESGRHCDRPELAKAAAHATSAGAKLVIAKLDRLARDVHFTASIMKGGVDFVCCDNPHANKFTLHILAAVAEHESEMIRERTRAALQAAKAKGVKLGSHREGHWDDPARAAARLAGIRKAASISAQLRHESAGAGYAHVSDEIAAMRQCGLTLRYIADALNQKGLRTRRGKRWHAAQVARVLRLG